jgi:hypothetical protein
MRGDSHELSATRRSRWRIGSKAGVTWMRREGRRASWTATVLSLGDRGRRSGRGADSRSALLDEPALVNPSAPRPGSCSRTNAGCRGAFTARGVRASRGRIVAAADAERGRIERNLHDGAQQRLRHVVARARLEASAPTRHGRRSCALGTGRAGDRRLRELAQESTRRSCG